jgi:serine/threonine-protein phosphatase 2A regulatory subunit B
MSPQRKSNNYNNNNNSGHKSNNKDYKDSKWSNKDSNTNNDIKLDDRYSWTPFCQFQSHQSEFDYLKSLEIEEKINQIRFCRPVGNNFFLLSCNDKTIKLWKIGHGRDQYMPTAQESLSCDGRLTLPIKHSDRSKPNFTATPKRLYQNAHAYHINSITLNSDGETFTSADDLSIHWWNYEYSDQCFNIVDMKPPNMEELTEVITAVRFHPSHCNIMMYSSSRGTIKVADTRQAALCDKYAKVFEEPEDPAAKSFFSEIIASISDINFSSDGRYMISRDYLTLKIWDINMDKGPVTTIPVHNHLRSVLCDLYESDSIFDKFEAVFSPNDNSILTGSYSNEFSVFGKDGTKVKHVELPSSGITTTTITITTSTTTFIINIKIF